MIHFYTLYNREFILHAADIDIDFQYSVQNYTLVELNNDEKS